MHIECLCLGCKVVDKGIVDDNVNVNGIVKQETCLACHEQSSFADGNINDNVNDNVDKIVSEDEVDIYLLREKPPRVKPLSIQVSPLQINVNKSLQSWLDDDNIVVNAIFQQSFRCDLAGPSECRKTFLLKNLFLSCIHFDRLNIIGPSGDQYEDLKNKVIVFIKEINIVPSPDHIPKDLKKLMIFDDVGGKEPVINEYFCRCRNSNCNMIYLKQNIFSTDR